VLGGPKPGGAMMLSKAVENFPATGQAERGSAIMRRWVKQAADLGVRFRSATVTRLEAPAPRRFAAHLQHQGLARPGVVRGRAVVVASGATPRWLGLAGEVRLRGKSLHTCAYCDGAFYKGKDVCVVGGGDGALEAAHFLSHVAKTVTLVHRRTTWRGSSKVADALKHIKSVRVLRPYTVHRWLLKDGKLVGAALSAPETPQVEVAGGHIQCAGVFLEIGRKPHSAFVPSSAARDSKGFLRLRRGAMTSLPGLFAAGQVADGQYQQAVTAAADGAKAAMDAGRWLDGSLQAEDSAEKGDDMGQRRRLVEGQEPHHSTRRTDVLLGVCGGALGLTLIVFLRKGIPRGILFGGSERHD